MRLKDFLARTDLAVQTLLVVLILPNLLMTPFAPSVFLLCLLGLFFLGSWQLISALSHFLFNGDQFRGWYFMASITYLGALALGTHLLEELHLRNNLPWVLGIVFFGVIPFIAGLWYYRLTLKGKEGQERDLTDTFV